MTPASCRGIASSFTTLRRCCRRSMPPSSPAPPPCSSLPATGWRPPCRLAATDAAADQGLLRALKEGIEQAELRVASMEGVKKAPLPKHFALVDNPGDKEVILKRSCSGGEDVSVSCSLLQGPFSDGPPEAGAMDGKGLAAHIVVSVTRSLEYPCLEISCVTYGQEPILSHISFMENGEYKEFPYEGPSFSDFEEDVRIGFHNYVLSRGIDSDFCAFIGSYLYHRDQCAYLKWLQNVESFMDK